MILRAVAAADVPALAAIHADSFERPWSAADLADFAARPGAVALLVERDASICGFILCWVVAEEAEVLTLAVRPSAREAGLGRALVTAASGLCGDAGAHTMWLEVAQDNAAALALYAACGFEPAGRRPGYYDRAAARSPVDAIVLRQTLQGALNSGGSNSYPGL